MPMMKDELYDKEHGSFGFLYKSSQPQMKITRKYKGRPELTTVYFSDICGFEMPTMMAQDPDVWVHEFTENTLSSMIKEQTGKNGLKWKFTRYYKDNGLCMATNPTVAHFITSLNTFSGLYNLERGFSIINDDMYEKRFMKRATGKIPPDCVLTVIYRDMDKRGKSRPQTFNSCSKIKKNIIRRRVLELYYDGLYIGYFKRKDLPPVGICDAILAEFGVRIWTYTIQRIIRKYSL